MKEEINVLDYDQNISIEEYCHNYSTKFNEGCKNFRREYEHMFYAMMAAATFQANIIKNRQLSMEEHANQFKPEWVSVKDRLPEECVHVIIYGRYTSDSPMKANQALYVPKKRKFYQEGVISKNVTHWMPLPEPPQIIKDTAPKVINQALQESYNNATEPYVFK